MRRRSVAVLAEDAHAAGAGLLATVGLHAVTPERIAERLGAPPAAVTAAVPRFDEFVAEVFRAAVSGELAEVRRAMLQHPDPVDQLDALVGLLAEPAREEITAAWLEAFSLARYNAPLAEVVRSQQQAWIRCFAFVIERVQRAGLGREEADAAAVASHLITMIDGLSASGLVGFDPGVSRVQLLQDVVLHELGLPLDQKPPAARTR